MKNKQDILSMISILLDRFETTRSYKTPEDASASLRTKEHIEINQVKYNDKSFTIMVKRNYRKNIQILVEIYDNSWLGDTKLDTNLQELNATGSLSPRAYYGLIRRLDITDLKELQEYTADDLLELENFGKRSLLEILELLEYNDLHLKEGDTK